MSTLSVIPTVPWTLAVRRFAVHFAEMCASMCIGGIALDFMTFSAIGLVGPANFVAQYPEISIAIIAINATIAMAGYMAFRGHPIRHNVEMSGTNFVGGIALIGAYWLGAIPGAKLEIWPALFSFMCGPLCLLMFLLMVVRFDVYGGRVGAAAALTASTATGDYTCPMHSEIRQADPGRCPVCGMTLKLRRT
jgi:hypothetical protein